jgi:hypothetical protein
MISEEVVRYLKALHEATLKIDAEEQHMATELEKVAKEGSDSDAIQIKRSIEAVQKQKMKPAKTQISLKKSIVKNKSTTKKKDKKNAVKKGSAKGKQKKHVAKPKAKHIHHTHKVVSKKKQQNIQKSSMHKKPRKTVAMNKKKTVMQKIPAKKAGQLKTKKTVTKSLAQLQTQKLHVTFLQKKSKPNPAVHKAVAQKKPNPHLKELKLQLANIERLHDTVKKSGKYSVETLAVLEEKIKQLRQKIHGER